MRAEQSGRAVNRRELRAIRILGRANELDVTSTQCFELICVEARPLQYVGEQLDHELLIARQERTADRNGFGARARLDRAADRSDCFGEGVRVARACTFLQQS